jgi:hypothetical protein
MIHLAEEVIHAADTVEDLRDAYVGLKRLRVHVRYRCVFISWVVSVEFAPVHGADRDTRPNEVILMILGTVYCTRVSLKPSICSPIPAQVLMMRLSTTETPLYRSRSIKAQFHRWLLRQLERTLWLWMCAPALVCMFGPRITGKCVCPTSDCTPQLCIAGIASTARR